MSFAALLFYLCGALAIASALSMLLNARDALASALSLVVTMVSLAVIYVLLEAHLVAAIQVLVYAGAVVVLFLFVVMLLNLRREEFSPSRQKLVRAASGFALVLALTQFLRWLAPGLRPFPALPTGFGSHRVLGIALYTDYVLLVELVSLVLLAAIVASVVLVKRRLDS